jgi:thymidylate synthase
MLYKKLVRHVLNTGANIKVRGKKTLECTNCLITLSNIDNDHINFDNTQAHQRQDQYEHYRSREIEWYESGCLLAKHAPADFWKKISSKDGKIQSNYGYLILHEKKPYTANGITSYKNVLNILKKDKFSRQAILHYNLPSHYPANKKDIPCTICTQILIRNGKLNFLVFQRSADLFFGQKFLRRLKAPAFRPGQVWEGMHTPSKLLITPKETLLLAAFHPIYLFLAQVSMR